MSKILLLGYSDIAIRRVIPAVNKIDEFLSIDIASRSKVIKPINKIKKVYESYENAIHESDSDVVYISLPNSNHFEYAIKSLNNNKNVIIDKPAVLKLSHLNKLVNVAEKNNLFITQSCVFQYHNAWKKFKELSKKYKNGTLTHTFFIPELSTDNFRMSEELGGGSINDMGIYASELGRNFWGSNAKSIFIKDTSSKSDKVNMGFSGYAKYGNEKKANFEFGFNKEYKNKVIFKSNNFSISYERVFSPPDDFNTSLIIKENESTKEITVGFDDTFTNYLKAVFAKYKNNDIDTINKEFKDSNEEFLNFKKELN